MNAHEKNLRRAAYVAVRRALSVGALVRPTECNDCGQPDPRIHAHHHRGYEADHQTDVVWLCWNCHSWRHSTGHRRTEPIPSEVRDALRIIQAWTDRPSVEEVPA